MLRPSLLVGITALLALTDAQGQQERQTFRIVERWATRGTPEVVEFGSIAGMAESPDGSVWVSDDLNRLIVSIDRRGRPTRIVARPGDGPGEVGNPTMLVPRPTGGVALYDIGHNAIELFGADARFERRIVLEAMVMNPKGFAVHRGGDFVLSGGIARNGHAIHQFGPDGRLRESWHPIPETRDRMAGIMVAGGPVQALQDGSVLFSQAAPHRILHYPASGRQGRLVASDPRLLAPIGDDFFQVEGNRRKFRWWFPQSRAVFVLPNGRILNVVRLRDEGTSIWEVYSPTGDLLVRRKVGRAYAPWSLARNGDILASYIDPDTGEHVAARISLEVR